MTSQDYLSRREFVAMGLGVAASATLPALAGYLWPAHDLCSMRLQRFRLANRPSNQWRAFRRVHCHRPRARVRASDGVAQEAANAVGGYSPMAVVA
jgi:hypothetical protein